MTTSNKKTEMKDIKGKKNVDTDVPGKLVQCKHCLSLGYIALEDFEDGMEYSCCVEEEKKDKTVDTKK